MGRGRRIGTCGAVMVLAAAPFWGEARAEFFAGFYKSVLPPSARAVVTPDDPEERALTGADCVAAILDAQARYGIPDNLLLAIGVQEAGRRGKEGLTVWPWTVNAAGEGAFFKTRAEAMAWVEGKRAAGIASIDVGCMQVNQRWHGANFDTLDLAFEPLVNVDYAARYLSGLYQETGDWWAAAGRYHSATEAYQKTYLAALKRNQSVVNAGLGQLLGQARRSSMFTVAAAEAAAPPPPPEPPVFWGSAHQAEEAQFSIYSAYPIRPVLPDYRIVN